MPSIQFHISHSHSPPEKARKIHEALDNIAGLPFFDMRVHSKWRKLTHQPLIAAYIGFLYNGVDGAVDALNHLRDDLMFSHIFDRLEQKWEKTVENQQQTAEAEDSKNL